MMLSRARPLALRTLSRQQRALSAAPQPVYEPHVARTSVQIESRPPTLGEEQSDTASGAGYFKTPATPPPRREDSSTLSDAVAATREQLDAAAAPPE